ncbi:MAG: hypothetical protein PHN69_04945 [Candidatus Pacebacteria bacterium]|nr:hypothetical protein [Candidatus Paceibacterota bacterium]
MKLETVFIYTLIFILIAFFGLFFAFPLMWTWNYVMPYVFGLPVITWGQAWCLNFISSLLMKSVNVGTK